MSHPFEERRQVNKDLKKSFKMLMFNSQEIGDRFGGAVNKRAPHQNWFNRSSDIKRTTSSRCSKNKKKLTKKNIKFLELLGLKVKKH